MNILVLRFSALGDVAMTIPAIYSVAREYPQHTLTILTSTFTAQLFIGAPSNVLVLSIEKKESHGIIGIWRILSKLSKERVDAVADLHNVFRSWIIDAFYYILKKPVKIVDKMRSERYAILQKHAKTSRLFVLRYFDVFARLGLSTTSHFSSILPKGTFILPNGIPIKNRMQWIGIAPFARYRSKTLDEDCTIRLLNLLEKQNDTKVFLFGAKGKEAQKLCEWAKGKKNIMVIAGQLQLKAELAIIAHLDVMISMDSANMHLASLVGTRVISVWGGTTPACGFLGFGQKLSDVVLVGLPCQPCSIAGSDTCPFGHMNCVKAIKPETIIDKLLTDKTKKRI